MHTLPHRACVAFVHAVLYIFYNGSRGFVVVCSSDFHVMFNEVTPERIRLLRAAILHVAKRSMINMQMTQAQMVVSGRETK